MNKLYPIFLKLEGANCLVIGGGEVAQRKVESLLECGANVRVVSLQINDGIVSLSKQYKNLTLDKKKFEENDMQDVSLVIASTDDESVNRKAAKEAIKRGVYINVVDVPDLCTFYVPSVVARGDLKIAVSTGGAAPAFAKKIRKELEVQFDEKYAEAIRCLNTVRADLAKTYPDDTKKRGEILKALVNSDIMGKFRDFKEDELLEEMRRWITSYTE